MKIPRVRAGAGEDSTAMTHLTPELINALMADRLAEAAYARLLREQPDRAVRRRGRRVR